MLKTEKESRGSHNRLELKIFQMNMKILYALIEDELLKNWF